MTGIPELLLGLGIIGGTTALIVGLTLWLARKEEREAEQTKGSRLHFVAYENLSPGRLRSTYSQVN